MGGVEKKTRAAVLQAFLFWYQHSVSLSLSVLEEKHWRLPGGACAHTRARP